MQASEGKYLRKLERVTIFDEVHNIVIRELSTIESLRYIFVLEYQFRWFGHESRMSQERFPKQTLYAKVNGKKAS